MLLLKTIHRREEGVTLITAIMVTFVIMIMSVTVIALSVHNSQQSGQERRRVQSVAAAEAGLDYYFSQLAALGSSPPPCSVSGTVPSSPPATFTVTPTFYSVTETALPCPYTPGTVPASILIRSVGRSGNDASRRAMEAYVKLTPTSGGTFGSGGAVFGNAGIDFQARAVIGGDQYNDADVYSNGNISMKANSIVYGSVYGQAAVTMGSGAEVKKNVWANGAINLGGNARIRGDATSSTSSISNGSWHIFGNARAGTTIGNGTVYGTRTPSSPSAAPPSRPYPSFAYDPAAWSSAGYTVRTYTDCALAVSDIASWFGTGSGNYVVRVTGGCTMTFSGNVTVRGDLGIVTDGSVYLPTNKRFSVAAGTGPFSVLVFAGLAEAPGCAVTIDPNAGFGASLNVLIYTPPTCTGEVRSNSGIVTGAIIGGSLVFKHSLSFQYIPPTVPGYGVGGFQQDVLYKREVVTA